MAVYFLTEQLSQIPRNLLFAKLQNYHVRNLSIWLSHSQFKQCMSANQKWSLVSSEDVKWLILALQMGITEKTIINMALDIVSYEYDMLNSNTQVSISYQLTDLVNYANYKAWYDYYSDIASYQSQLFKKLQDVLNH